jgi:hypothetical protein
MTARDLKPELEINRSTLVKVIDLAITRGGPTHNQWCPDPGIRKLQVDEIKYVAQTTKAVDFGAYEYCYGCPVSQAGYKGSYAFWFTNHYDRLMHQNLEVPRSIESGWAVRVID